MPHTISTSASLLDNAIAAVARVCNGEPCVASIGSWNGEGGPAVQVETFRGEEVPEALRLAIEKAAGKVRVRWDGSASRNDPWY